MCFLVGDSCWVDELVPHKLGTCVGNLIQTMVSDVNRTDYQALFSMFNTESFWTQNGKEIPSFRDKKNFDLRSLVRLNTNLNWAWWSFWHVCHLTLSLHKWLNLNWAEPQRGVKTCPKSTKNTFPAKQIKDVVDLKSNSVLKSNKAHNLCHQFLSISY